MRLVYSFEFVTPDLKILYTSKHLGLLSSLAIDERLLNISTFESQNVVFNVCEIYVRETLARVFYLTSEKMLAKDNQSSF
jgi:hypothetical protein